MKLYELSVVGSAYNESSNILEFVERLQKVFTKKNIRGEIVLVNDKSTDDTGEIIDILKKRYSNVHVIHNEKNLGIARSWKKGIHAAEGRYVCLMDTDLQNIPEEMYKLYQEITFTNVDLVQGWRNHIGRTKHSPQYFLSRGLNMLLNTLFGMHLHDNKSGFVIARKEVLVDVIKHKKNYKHFQTLISVTAHAKGYIIRDIETLFDERKLGKSYLSGKLFKTTVDTFADVVKGFFEFRVLDWRDTSLHDFVNEHAPHVKNKALSLRYRIYHLLYPLHHWMISYNTTQYYEDMDRSQWLTNSKIREYQELKLRQLISHVYYHVPYYRDVMDSLSLKPEDIQTIDDLKKLPIIDKADVRENMHLGIMSNNHDKKKIQKVTTSGSTGEPFTVYAEKQQRHYDLPSGLGGDLATEMFDYGISISE